MNPGRELDALIGKKVMGLEIPEDADLQYLNTCMRLPEYSADIKAAWEVVEKMKDQDIQIHSTGRGYLAFFDISPNPTMSYADTAPHAICLAALRAVGVEELEPDEPVSGAV